MTKKGRVLKGVIHKVSGQNTVSVKVEGRKRHSLYGKVYKTTKKYLAHVAGKLPTVGTEVEIIESRPISKRKKWLVLEESPKS